MGGFLYMIVVKLYTNIEIVEVQIMKVYIRSASLSRSEALRRIANKLKNDPDFKDCEVTVNSEHNCVDVTFPKGDMNQVYPKEGTPYNSSGYKFVYVGPNNGDYVKQKYTRKRRQWKDEPGLEKHVDRMTSKSNHSKT